MNKREATVIDLDGTLLDCNSLELYLATALRHLLRAGRIDRVAGMAWWIGLRRLRLISHETMKYRAIALAGSTPEMTARFVDEAKRHYNPRVLDFIERAGKRGDVLLLATAAAECYVPVIWHGEFVASPMGGPDCRDERKRDAVARWLDSRNLHLGYFLTDHTDDLPLARHAMAEGATVVLVNPDALTLKLFKAELPSGSLLVIGV